MKRLTYKQLGKTLGEYLEQPTVSLSDGGKGYKADAVFACRLLFEDKDTTNPRSAPTQAKQQLTCYASEMMRAQKPGAELDWVMVATDLRKYWEIRHFTAGQPQSPWMKAELAYLPIIAPGSLDTTFTDTERLIWDNPNIHHAKDGTLVKTCTICQEEKMFGAYNSDSSKKDGLATPCSECASNQGRERYQERYHNDPEFRESEKARLRAHYHAKKKEEANAALSASKTS